MKPPGSPMRRPELGEVGIVPPPGPSCPVDLSDNTNLFGVPPVAAAVVRAAQDAELTRYPSPYSDTLRDALARYHQVPTECVITGCGSDAIIDTAIRAFTRPGDGLAFVDPTFSMIPAFARINGLDPLPIACAGSPDASVMRALLGTRARLVYLCSPNNPTGARTTVQALETARERLRADVASSPLLILDQAYAEFDEMGGVAPQDIAGDEPVLVTRTMSKAFGLAGLRVGYGIGPAAIIAEMQTVRGPYTVGAIAERAAVAALTHDLAWVRSTVVAAIELRERFIEALKSAGFAPLPSAANFVLVPVASAREADTTLRAAGIAVRAFDRLTGIGDAIRITVGPWPLLAACLTALKRVRR